MKHSPQSRWVRKRRLSDTARATTELRKTVAELNARPMPRLSAGGYISTDPKLVAAGEISCGVTDDYNLSITAGRVEMGRIIGISSPSDPNSRIRERFESARPQEEPQAGPVTPGAIVALRSEAKPRYAEQLRDQLFTVLSSGRPSTYTLVTAERTGFEHTFPMADLRVVKTGRPVRPVPPREQELAEASTRLGYVREAANEMLQWPTVSRIGQDLLALLDNPIEQLEAAGEDE